MPRKRKPSTPSFRQPLPFVSSPLLASPRNPPSPFKPSISPPEARSVPIDCLSGEECVILPCSQLTYGGASSAPSKRRSPRLARAEGTGSRSAAGTKRRGRQASGGGARGKKKTPVKGGNKKPVVTVVRNDVEHLPTTSTSGRRFNVTRSGNETDSTKRDGNKSADATDPISPDMLKRNRGNALIDQESVPKTGPERDDDEENFLHSKNLLTTPPGRNQQRKKKSSSSSSSSPLGNVINTPHFVDPPTCREDKDDNEVVVVPDSLPEGDPDDAAVADTTFLTPRRRPIGSQVLVPETPVAEMGLTHVEKVTMARRRFREEQAQTARERP